MTNEPAVRVVPTPHFEQQYKRLRKKYRHIGDDLKPLIERLERGETPGDQVQGTRFTVYKARIASTDAQRGKSGGYRVIYYLRTKDFIFLIEIYPKSERVDVSGAELRQIIEEVEAELGSDDE